MKDGVDPAWHGGGRIVAEARRDLRVREGLRVARGDLARLHVRAREAGAPRHLGVRLRDAAGVAGVGRLVAAVGLRRGVERGDQVHAPGAGGDAVLLSTCHAKAALAGEPPGGAGHIDGGGVAASPDPPESADPE